MPPHKTVPDLVEAVGKASETSKNSITGRDFTAAGTDPVAYAAHDFAEATPDSVESFLALREAVHSWEYGLNSNVRNLVQTPMRSL